MPDLPPDVGRGFEEIENNPFVVDAPDDKVGLADLADLDGVGPATVRNLKDAGIQEPSDLYGLSQSQIAAVKGIGPKTAAQLRQQVVQGGNRDKSRGFRDDAIDKARDIHAERSEAERRTDEAFNAKTSFSFSQWQESPGQYDMPGVDTIPRDRRLARTKQAAGNLAESGLVENVEATTSGPDSSDIIGTERASNIEGIATGKTAKVKTAQDDPESTLAHELGHLADKAGGGQAGITNELFGANVGEEETDRQGRLRKEGAKLASRRRSISLKPEVIEERAKEGDFGGGGFNEVFADAFAEMVEEPRRAKSEAPELYKELQDEFREQKDGFITPF